MDEVREAFNEDDPELKHSKLHHLEIIKDLKEFGQNQKMYEISKMRKQSSTLDENGPIIEELEKVKKVLSRQSSHGSIHHINSPRQNLKVDEVDSKIVKPRTDSFYSSSDDEDEKIDVITEEDETAKNLDDSEKYQAGM